MKIMAIGGGNNSNIRKNGLPQVYEQENIDKEIIRISNKKTPNVLFVSHASDLELQEASFNKIVNTYQKMYSCPVKLLTIEMLKDFKQTLELVRWADIIYVGGGNIKKMLDLWKQFGFDELLQIESIDEKVLCGISAGAGCWFSHCCSDYLQMENPNAPFALVQGLNMIDTIFNPHASYPGKMESIKELLKDTDMKGISLTDNMAIEIIGERYKLIEGISSENQPIMALLSYWKEGKYYIEQVSKDGLVEELTNRFNYEYKLGKNNN